MKKHCRATNRLCCAIWSASAPNAGKNADAITIFTPERPRNNTQTIASTLQRSRRWSRKPTDRDFPLKMPATKPVARADVSIVCGEVADVCGQSRGMAGRNLTSSNPNRLMIGDRLRLYRLRFVVGNGTPRRAFKIVVLPAFERPEKC